MHYKLICPNRVLVSIFKGFAYVRLLFFLTPFADADWAGYSTIGSKCISESFSCPSTDSCLPRVKRKATWPGSLSSFVSSCKPRAWCLPDGQESAQFPSPNQTIPTLLHLPCIYKAFPQATSLWRLQRQRHQTQAGGVNCQSLGVGEGLGPWPESRSCCLKMLFSRINFLSCSLPSQSTNLLISFPATEKIHPTCDKHRARERQQKASEKLSHGCERSSS